MKRVEKVVKNLQNELASKNILEVACGCGEFSICAGKIAETVHCIDLDKKRLLPDAENCENLFFSEMNAAEMSYGDGSFDTVVLYNAIGHLEEVMDGMLCECLRVLRASGSMYVISSFKMDKRVIYDHLLPLLENKKISYQLTEDNAFLYVQIRK